MIVLGIVLIVLGACIIVIPDLARLSPLGWILVIVGVVLVVLYAVEGYALMQGGP